MFVFRSIYFVFLLSFLFVYPVDAQQERISSTHVGVDLIEIKKSSATGHTLGSDYLAFNRNQNPVAVFLKLTEKENVYDGLIWIPIRIEPNERGYLGWVVQSDNSRPANWEYEWRVDPLE